MIFKNFKSYVPDTESKKPLVEIGVIFARDENGNDWYDCLSKFPDETHKFILNKDNVIMAYSKVASSLPMIPDGCSVADSKYIPKNFENNSTFMYDEKTSKVKARVYSSEEVKSQVDKRKNALMDEAMSLINPLQYAVNLEMASEQEKERLTALQKYVVLLNRVSDQEGYPANVEWPEKP